MSFDPFVITSLFSTFGKVAHNEISDLIKSKIITHKGATLYAESSELEFAFVFSLGDRHSSENSILKKIKSINEKPLEFENVIEINGHGLPNNENLVEIGIITKENNSAKIDFGKLITDIKSSNIFIKVRVKISSDLVKFLIPSRMNKTSERIGDERIETNIEMSLDYANVWRKVFDQFTVRDIVHEFNLEVSPQTIIEQIPERSKHRIRNAGLKALDNNKDAVKFLRIMSECFLSFEKDEYRQKLFDSISIEPKGKLFIKQVYPTMQTMSLAITDQPVVLPGKLRITVGGQLEGDEITLKGVLTIDLKKFSKIINDISKDLQNKTQKLKI